MTTCFFSLFSDLADAPPIAAAESLETRKIFTLDEGDCFGNRRPMVPSISRLISDLRARKSHLNLQ